MQITLPTPCPTCAGPVVYSGRGRRPDYCSKPCKAAHDTGTRPERREVADLDVEEASAATAARAAIDALPESHRTRAARDSIRSRVYRDPSDSAEPGSVVSLEAVKQHGVGDEGETQDDPRDGFTTDGYVKKNSVSRRKDPAAQWLAQHHPEELANFGHSF